MRVLFISCDPREGAVTRYRCSHLATALRTAGHTANVATIYDPVIRLDHDIVVLHRICANEEGQALADAVRKSGATLIYGADDLVFEEGLHLAMLKQADGVLVSTNALAEFAKEAGAKDVAVVRNTRLWWGSLSLHDFPNALWERHRPQQEGGTFTILYPAGTATHNEDFLEIAPALKDFMEQHATARLVLVGPLDLPDILKPFRPCIGLLPLLPMDQYLALLHIASVVVAPLAPTRFNRGKSELKWIEAGSWSQPTLASRWGGFAEVIRDGENGLLASTSEEWIEKLTRLHDDKALRRKLGLAGKLCQRFDFSTTQPLTEVPFLEWRVRKDILPVRFVNPRGFVKGKVKSVLRKVRG